MDSGDPSGEWEAAVAGEGEGLAGGGGVEADVASEGEDDQDCGDGFYTSGAVGESLFQHVDEGVAGGIVESVVDAGDSEEHGDQKNETH